MHSSKIGGSQFGEKKCVVIGNTALEPSYMDYWYFFSSSKRAVSACQPPPNKLNMHLRSLAFLTVHQAGPPLFLLYGSFLNAGEIGAYLSSCNCWLTNK